ncbi:MAG: hypothetical protein V4439_02040 [Patescibacteria group bacterium]
MTQEDALEKIKEICNKAKKKLMELSLLQDKIISKHSIKTKMEKIKELEDKLKN